jgi:hypothetical protein
MKRKSPRIESRNSPAPRKRPRPASNGHRGGNGSNDGASVVLNHGSAGDEFPGQPPIEPLLSASRRQKQPDNQLDRAQLLAALTALRKGDFSVRLPIDLEGLDGKIADQFNEVVELNGRMAHELERLSRVVGKEGKIGQRADIGEVGGAWKHSVKCVNNLISDLVHPINETGRVIGAVAKV